TSRFAYWNDPMTYQDPKVRPAVATQRRHAARAGRGLFSGAVSGILAAGVALGIAELVAALFRPQASPVIAIGDTAIDHTPPALALLVRAASAKRRDPVWDDAPPRADRRGFLLTSTAAATTAAVAGAGGYVLLGRRFSIAKSRAAVRLTPPPSAPAVPANTDL